MGFIIEKYKRKKALHIYEEYYSNKKEVIEEILNYYKNSNKKIAIWGAGIKGLAFLSTLNQETEFIDYIFDIDKKKQGKNLFLEYKVVDYKSQQYKDVDVVLVMNTNLENEVAFLLEEEKYDVKLLNLDSIIEGDLTVEDAIELYRDSQTNQLTKNKIGIEDVAAVVFLYNFDERVIENIKSYHNDIHRIYAFDNSEIKNTELINELKSISNVVYLDGNGNQGLSKAINETANRAIALGCQWFVTFDQDSLANKNMIIDMIRFLENWNSEKLQKLAIISPSIHQSKVEFAKGCGEYSYQSIVIQSGAMHNLNIFKKLNGYDEALFIDMVDYDYCLRARVENYLIIKLNRVILKQNMNDDNIEVKQLGNKKIILNKFPPIRYYYIVRNVLYCLKKHRGIDGVVVEQFRIPLKMVLRTLCYEKKKIKRGKAVIFGFLHYKLSKMGKCEWKI